MYLRPDRNQSQVRWKRTRVAESALWTTRRRWPHGGFALGQKRILWTLWRRLVYVFAGHTCMHIEKKTHLTMAWPFCKLVFYVNIWWNHSMDWDQSILISKQVQFCLLSSEKEVYFMEKKNVYDFFPVWKLKCISAKKKKKIDTALTHTKKCTKLAEFSVDKWWYFPYFRSKYRLCMLVRPTLLVPTLFESKKK